MLCSSACKLAYKAYSIKPTSRWQNAQNYSATPTCLQPFQVRANITNNGTAPTFGSAVVLIEDIHVASNTVRNSAYSAVPVMNPGANWVVAVNLTVSTYYNESHVIRVTIDPGNTLAETNETDNVLTTTYILQQGGC